MQVSKWGNSLAIRLPAAVVEALGLREGDDVILHAAGKRSWRSKRRPVPKTCSPGSGNSAAGRPKISGSTDRGQ